jgi:hypothetical protein
MASIYTLGKSLELLVQSHGVMQQMNNDDLERLMDRVDNLVKDLSENIWSQGLTNAFGSGGIAGLGILGQFIPGAGGLADLASKAGPLAVDTINKSYDSKNTVLNAKKDKAMSLQMQQKQQHQREMHDQLTRFLQTYSQVMQQLAQARRTAAAPAA